MAGELSRRRLCRPRGAAPVRGIGDLGGREPRLPRRRALRGPRMDPARTPRRGARVSGATGAFARHRLCLAAGVGLAGGAVLTAGVPGGGVGAQLAAAVALAALVAGAQALAGTALARLLRRADAGHG